MVKKKASGTKKQTNFRVPTTFEDFKSAALLISVAINLAFFIVWLALRFTTRYDEQVFQFLFTR